MASFLTGALAGGLLVFGFFYLLVSPTIIGAAKRTERHRIARRLRNHAEGGRNGAAASRVLVEHAHFLEVDK